MAKPGSQKEADQIWMREYAALRRELFPDECRQPTTRQVHDYRDGRVECGGGFRRIYVAGGAAQ